MGKKPRIRSTVVLGLRATPQQRAWLNAKAAERGLSLQGLFQGDHDQTGGLTVVAIRRDGSLRSHSSPAGTRLGRRNLPKPSRISYNYGDIDDTHSSIAEASTRKKTWTQKGLSVPNQSLRCSLMKQ